ncbi:MAG: pyruvate, phosphate dikinase, partial [Acidobacteria bacterium]
MTKKYVYFFGAGQAEGSAEMRDLLGGKGAGLAEMTNAGLPVPPGFTITTEACNAYFRSGESFPEGLWDQVMEALKRLEEVTGKTFGGGEYPLLVSVRSGAKVSMPGMMDTILNLGLNDETVVALARASGDERFAYDAYRRFIQMFGSVVLGVSDELFEEPLDALKRRRGVELDTDLGASDWRQLTETFKEIVRRETGEEFPQDPHQQLRLAIEAVFRSWNTKRAIDYRNATGIPHDLGTAVNVVTMVFGNMGWDSGTGVLFTRDPRTGEKVLYGEYLLNAQGEDVVAGIRNTKPIIELSKELPDVYRELVQAADTLERHYRDMQDVEFTIERGRLWLLQTRAGKRTAKAAIKIAVDMAQEGLIAREEALMRVSPSDVDSLLHPQFDAAVKQ